MSLRGSLWLQCGERRLEVVQVVPWRNHGSLNCVDICGDGKKNSFLGINFGGCTHKMDWVLDVKQKEMKLA